MSERIVQLDEEVIKGQIKELGQYRIMACIYKVILRCCPNKN